MASVINSFAITGVDGYVVKIETDTIYGQPSVNIVGLGDAAIKESRERMEASIINSGYEFPKMKIVINLAPSSIKKSGSHFDLPMVIGLLVKSNQINIEAIENFGILGELSLNGELRKVNGVLPMAIEAKNNGINNLIVPKVNMLEASAVSGINVFGFEHLKEVISFFQGELIYKDLKPYKKDNIISRGNIIDFQDVKGQQGAIDAAVLAASGGHNLLLSGVPGSGKSMIAQRISTILPSMVEEEALEVTKIYSVAGLLQDRTSLITERPYRAPHHNASTNALIGGGNNAMPGEISLAHNGVLFLDEIAEFNKKTLDALRQPLEDGRVTISRVKYTNIYPASFMLVAAMNPCPCGNYGNIKCKCTDYEVIKYRQRLSGPIMDRIDIQKYVNNLDILHLTNSSNSPKSSELKNIVESARKIQQSRFKKIQNINCNAQMTPALIEEFCKLDSEGIKLLALAYEKFNFSARTYHKFLKIARTYADIDNVKDIKSIHIMKSLMCRELDKEQGAMSVI